MDTRTLIKDFKEFFTCLISNNVDFLLIGGYAVGYYGYVRATVDIDVWIDRSLENADRVMRAVEQFGFGGLGLTREGLLKEDKVFRMGMHPNAIEILTGISGVIFSECKARRVIGCVDGLELPIISLEDLLKNKVASGRDKDLVDVSHLS